MVGGATGYVHTIYLVYVPPEVVVAGAVGETRVWSSLVACAGGCPTLFHYCRLDPQVFGRGGVSVMTLQYSSTGIGLITTTSLDPEKRRLKFPPRQIRGPTW